MIKGILFDFDGTLSDRYASAYDMYRWLLHEILPEEGTDSLHFEEMVQSCLLWDEYGTISRTHAMEMIRTKFAPDMNPEEWSDRWYENFCRFQKLQPECLETLTALRKRYRLGILSNGPYRNQIVKIQALGLEEYFDMVLVSGEIGIHKPDVRIFQTAAERLGLKCEECAMIGDTFSTDISGAIKAGMKPVWFSSDRRCVSSWNVEKADSYQKLREIFLAE